MEPEEIIKGKRIRFQLTGIYYNGLVLSIGNEYIKIRDVKNNIVFIKIDAVMAFEVME